MTPLSRERLALATTFAGAARRYWLSTLPCVRRELRSWQRSASEIPDPVLRGLAIEAQRTKRAHLDGVAAFAAFAPPASRLAVVQALTAYQLAFDYIDTISEQPNTDPVANGLCLNQALCRALEPGRPHLDYYAHHDRHEDAGYLEHLIDTCRAAVCRLPSYPVVAERALHATKRIVNYQVLNHGDAQGSLDAFTQWAYTQATPSTGLRWWEAGAAGGSPLPVFALVTTAGDPDLQPDHVTAIEDAYFPWIASLSTLLDSLVDQHEDTAKGQHNLIDYYTSPQETATRLELIAAQALLRIQALTDKAHHTLLLAAMASSYHCTRRASSPDTRLVTQRLLDTMGDLATPTTLVLMARHNASRLASSRLIHPVVRLVHD